ncbi:MAG: glycoside hydrolase family 43 protein [Acidimicrobiales bacterium]
MKLQSACRLGRWRADPKGAAFAAGLAAVSCLSLFTSFPARSYPPPANAERPGLLITPHRNLPDPFVIHVGKQYYLYSSQTSLWAPPASLTESAGFTLFHWKATRPVLTKVPSWASDGFTWSPDVRRIQGRYVMYFNAWVVKALYFAAKSKGLRQRAQCIGMATSRNPGGPFTPVDGKPLVCQLADHGDIDPRTFVAPNGHLYLDWKSDNNAFVPLRPTHIWAQELSADGMRLVGPRRVLMSGQQNSWTAALVEAPDMVYAEHIYWLFYSGSWYNGPHYSIGVAACSGPLGPCRQISSRPWLTGNAQGNSPGEESLFQNAQGWWMVYSPWDLLSHRYRPVELAKVAFGPFGPYLAKFSG